LKKQEKDDENGNITVKDLGEIISGSGLDFKEILAALKGCNHGEYSDLELDDFINDWKRAILSDNDGRLREYKDRLFRFLFSDKDRLLSLYNALNNSNYKDSSALTIVELEDSICLGMKGDLSFILSSDLWLYEEQSSWNPNMPLRMLFYISDIYKRLVKRKQLYGSSLITLKNPHFVTFYCGDSKRMNVDEIELKLSDAFEKRESDPDMELKVKVININPGHNERLLSACETLKGYSLLNEKVKEYKIEGKVIDAAVFDAIKYCIENDVLSEFLTKYRNEVAIMLSGIYTFEDFKSDMEEDMSFLREERDQAKEELDEAKEELDTTKEELDRTKKELDRTRKNLEAVERDNSDMMKKVEYIMQEIQSIKATNIQKDSLINELKKQLSAK